MSMPSFARAALLCLPALFGLTGCFGPEPEEMAPVGEVDLRELPPACTDAPPPATPTRLLTRQEYDNTVRDLLGDATRPAEAFPKEPLVLGFENNADAHQVNPLLVSAYLEAAEAISQRALTQARARLLPCDEAQIGTAACGKAFLDALLPRAYRRPPTDAERATLGAFFDAALARDGFDAAVEQTLQVILQSPQFLYRIEQGQPAADGTWVLNGYELASRLSYFLWSSMPDEALFAAAANGELETREGMLRQVRRMLSDPKATDAVQSFFRQWLHLDGMEKLEKDTGAFPEFTPAVAHAWRGGVERFVSDVFWHGAGDLNTLFGSNVVYVNNATAPLYRVLGAPGEELVRVALPQDERSGILTQPGVMAMLGGPFDGSPVKRGVFVRERLLCQVLPAPPPDSAITPPDPDPGATTRERFAEHTSSAACAGCHVLIDPVGFGFENYDGLGRYRTTENGRAVDASGDVARVHDSVLAGPFTGAVDLSKKLAQSATVKQCVATQWYRFAMGRLEAEADGCSLKSVKDRFIEANGDVRELLVAITLSRAFRTRAPPAEAAR